MFGFLLPPILLNSLIELTTVGVLAVTLLLSIVSLVFLIHLSLKSRGSHHLQRFNSLWAVRLILVLFVSLWCLNELCRLPLIRRRYLSQFLPLTISEQEFLCKVHVVVSLGLLEPGFLATLLFLVNVSVNKRTPKGSWVLVFVLTTSFPVLTGQVIFLTISSLQSRLPEVFYRSSVAFREDSGEETVLCGYPLISTIVFGSFAAWYCFCFFASSFRVLTLIINKGLRFRLYGLATAVLISLPLQVVFLGMSSLWRPDQETAYSTVTTLVLLFTSILAGFGEGIVVISHIIDSLAAGDDLSPWLPRFAGVQSPSTTLLVNMTPSSCQRPVVDL